MGTITNSFLHLPANGLVNLPELSKGTNTYFIFQLRDELLVAGQDVRTVLNQAAQRPQPQSRLSIFLHDIEVRPVRATTHLTCLLNDSIYSLVKGVLEQWQSSLVIGALS